jgi:hypothetical protein
MEKSSGSNPCKYTTHKGAKSDWKMGQ